MCFFCNVLESQFAPKAVRANFISQGMDGHNVLSNFVSTTMPDLIVNFKRVIEKIFN
ncbi:hypothetical protein CFter6_2872 [Collimonas fungivorans]|uniref:Uncharacterized protein n=1 Tax=Collimonas fungivorans TaxID=158899 RepID=A0A127PCL6_9BURK|nr:hypothetical protein CFter6_2872 [Collimonas fungivorans]